MGSLKTHRVAITVLALLVITGSMALVIYELTRPARPTTIESGVGKEGVPFAAGPGVTPALQGLRSIELRNMDGGSLRLADYAGKLVLLHVWSSRWPDSLLQFDKLKAIHDRFSVDPRFMMIGLCADGQSEEVKEQLARSSLEWIQTVAGDAAPSAVDPANLLSAPQIMVIGAGGDVVAKDLDAWEAYGLVEGYLPPGKAATAEIKITIERITDQQMHHRMVVRPPGVGPFDRIPSPASDDAATQAKISLVDGQLQHGKPIHLTDGKLPPSNDTPNENYFFQAGTLEGRFKLEFEKPISIERINTYSWHAHDRSPQLYRVYGSDGAAAGFNAAPPIGINPAKAGWKLIATVDTRPTGWRGGVVGVTIGEAKRELGRFSHILFMVFPTETHDQQGHTFFSEIDIVERGSGG